MTSQELPPHSEPAPTIRPAGRLIVLQEQGLTFYRTGQLQQAETLFEAVLALEPRHFDALLMLGTLAAQTGRTARSAQYFERAVAANDTFAPAHNNLGIVLTELSRLDEAVASFDRAITLFPGFADAYCNRGFALEQLGRDHEALASYDAAIALQPDFVRAHSNRGGVLQHFQRHEEALRSYEAALVLDPGYVPAWSKRGTVLVDLKRPRKALDAFNRAIALDPQFAPAHFNAGICLLSTGQFEQGWRSYEWRKLLPVPIGARRLPQPLWTGAEPIEGKSLLLHAEQGLGDTVQFARYAILAAARGARVVLAVQPPLRALLTRLGTDVCVMAEDLPLPPTDFHCSLMSAPLAFGTTAATIAAPVPYLSADPQRVRRWRLRLGDDGFKVGLCWQGKPDYLNVGRFVPLAQFHRLAAVPGVRLISLQKYQGTEELDAMPEGMKVETLGEEFDAGPDAFVDSAAIISTLDLVITPDTALGHLAGALGRSTWLLLKYSPDWRWMQDGTSSSWYPAHRLFRQTRPGDWDGVFHRLREALETAVQGSWGRQGAGEVQGS
jgi:tetratricopeptide (TPR) repeat protein